jgi:transposase
MLRLDDISDLDTAKRVMQLLDGENKRLHDRVHALVLALAAARGEEGAEQYEIEIVRLQEQIAALNRRLFAASTEQQNKPRDADEPRERAKPPAAAREQTQLRFEEVVHELDDADRACTLCGKELKEWAGQSVEFPEIDIVQRSFVLKKHVQKKYTCSCGVAPVTAEGPLRMPGGGLYSVDFAIEVAFQKYGLHMPLERQVRWMVQQGLDMSSSTLWDQIEKLARVLSLSYGAMRPYVLSSEVVHGDETRWRMLNKGGKLWWVWCIARHDAVYYQIEPTRGHQVVVEMLDGFHGVLMVDDYAAYETARRLLPGVTIALCWAHVRRGFIEALDAYPECQQAIDLIGELFVIERDLPDWRAIKDPRLRAAALAQIAQTRHEQSKPFTEALLHWAGKQRGLPQSKLRQAIAYMVSNWTGLTRFLDEPRAPLSNNAAERAMRGPVVGRKNHYGSKSQRGTEVAALFYSLVESAKLAGVDPVRYMRAAAEAAIRDGRALLPHELRAELAAAR